MHCRLQRATLELLLLPSLRQAVVQEALDHAMSCGLQRTVLLIAHRLSTVQSADRIVCVGQGRVQEVRRLGWVGPAGRPLCVCPAASALPDSALLSALACAALDARAVWEPRGAVGSGGRVRKPSAAADAEGVLAGVGGADQHRDGHIASVVGGAGAGWCSGPSFAWERALIISNEIPMMSNATEVLISHASQAASPPGPQ